MSATKRTQQFFILECDEHMWFKHQTVTEKGADALLRDHNDWYHNDPDKEEAWPSRP